jgi:two-component system sensor histidine kinase CreC
MYVAAPVVDQGKIIGVLSVGKPKARWHPSSTVASDGSCGQEGLLGIALLIGLVVAAWINRSIGTSRAMPIP